MSDEGDWLDAVAERPDGDTAHTIAAVKLLGVRGRVVVLSVAERDRLVSIARGVRNAYDAVRQMPPAFGFGGRRFQDDTLDLLRPFAACTCTLYAHSGRRELVDCCPRHGLGT